MVFPLFFATARRNAKLFVRRQYMPGNGVRAHRRGLIVSGDLVVGPGPVRRTLGLGFQEALRTVDFLGCRHFPGEEHFGHRLLDEAHVVDAAVLLRQTPALLEIRNGKRGKKTDDEDHDHDLHQRKGRSATFVQE